MTLGKLRSVVQNLDHDGWVKMTGGLVVLLLCGLLVAGLWPFGLPRNNVSWLPGGGVRLGERGNILSTGPLATPDNAGCTIELWVRPRRTIDSGTLLAFHGPSGPVGVSLRQSDNGIRVGRSANPGILDTAYIPDAFRGGQMVFLAIAVDPSGTTVYFDGSLARQISNFGMASPCVGTFVVGDSPTSHNTWRGDLLRLAIYQRVRTAEQVVSDRRSETGASDRPDAFYWFNEGNGRSIRDHGTSGLNLYIPERYRVMHEKFLEFPWDAFEPTRGYVLDIVINVGGFIPFGFALSAFFLAIGRTRRMGLIVILLGFLVSLSIETLQAYLPTRDSDLTDVSTNTLGTGIGVFLYRACMNFPPFRAFCGL